MIRAEDEEGESHRSPDSDYYSDLLSRVDSAVGEDETAEKRRSHKQRGGSKRRNLAGWLGGGGRTSRRGGGLSNTDYDDDDDEETDEEAAAAEADMAAQRAAVDEVCMFPASLSEWLAQPMVKVLLVAVLSGLVCGIEAANAMFSVASVSNHFGLSPLEHSGLVTASILGGTFGGLVGGTVADLYGRRFVLVLQGMALVPAALVAASATSLAAVVYARALAAAVAMCSSCAGIAFTFELAPAHRRGAPPAAWAAAATGAWVAVRIASRYSPENAMAHHGWRVVGGGPHLLLALAQLLSLCRVPESPRWLASRGRLKEAEAGVRSLWGRSVVSSATAEVLRVELASLTDPNAHTHTLGGGSGGLSSNGSSATRPSSSSSNKAKKKKRGGGGSGQQGGGSAENWNWEPEWGHGNRPCEQCIAFGADVVKTAKTTQAALTRWRPVVTLLSSICTSSTSAGGLQVLYWGPNVLAPLMIAPPIAECILTLAPIAAVAGFAAFVADDRLVGRRPLVITGAVLMVSGSLLLSLLLMVFVKMPWHGPQVGLHWLLGLPGALGAAGAAAGWQLLVISLLPLLVCEATPNHSRCRALAMLNATSVIYAPVTLVGFDTAKDNAGALGPALLMYSCSAGLMLLFLVTVLLVETAGKDPEQILLETINRAGYVMFHATYVFRGTRCERCMAGKMSYQPVGEFQGYGQSLEEEDDDEEEEEDDEEHGVKSKGMNGKKQKKKKKKTMKSKRSKNGGVAREYGDGEDEDDFGTDAANGSAAASRYAAGSVAGLLGNVGLVAIRKSLSGGSSDSPTSPSSSSGRNGCKSRRGGNLNKKTTTTKGGGGWFGGGGGEGGRGVHHRLATSEEDDGGGSSDDGDEDEVEEEESGESEGEEDAPSSSSSPSSTMPGGVANGTSRHQPLPQQQQQQRHKRSTVSGVPKPLAPPPGGATRSTLASQQQTRAPPAPAAAAAAPAGPPAAPKPATRESVLARLEAMKNKNKNKNQPPAKAAPPSTAAATPTTAHPPPQQQQQQQEQQQQQASEPSHNPAQASSSSAKEEGDEGLAPPLNSDAGVEKDRGNSNAGGPKADAALHPTSHADTQQQPTNGAAAAAPEESAQSSSSSLLAELEEQKAAAVEAEDFEEAARLAATIKTLRSPPTPPAAAAPAPTASPAAGAGNGASGGARGGSRSAHHAIGGAMEEEEEEESGGEDDEEEESGASYSMLPVAAAGRSASNGGAAAAAAAAPPPVQEQRKAAAAMFSAMMDDF